MLNENSFKKLTVMVIILLLAVVTIIIVKPILISVLWGLIISYILYPIYLPMLKKLKNKNLTAGLVVFLLAVIIFLPLWIFFPTIVKQVSSAYEFFQQVDIFAILEKLTPASLESSKDLGVIINTFISKVAGLIFSQLEALFLNFTEILLQTVVILLVLFFSLRDQELLRDYVKRLSPFSKPLEKRLENKFYEITSSVLYGQVLVGILQGILTGIGLYLFGVPKALLLMFLTTLLAILPLIGAWLVWFPAAVYLLAIGKTGAGIGLLIYGVILISLVDNVVRTYIISKKSNVSAALIFIGMIGGLFAFGLIGIILGPLILSYFLILLELFKENKFFHLFSPDSN